MTVFNYTGAVQSYNVPSNATVVLVKVYGAGYDNPDKGGEGGYAEGRLAVTGGETLIVRCGGIGKLFGSNTPFNGGGYSDGYPGCGASDVRQGGTALSNRKIVAAGAGGTGYSLDGVAWDRGGDGGADVGEDGGSNSRDGKGGTQSSGGDGGTGASDGALGNGGDGVFDLNSSGGGGGSGRYGGGGGSGLGGGAGGSNYIGGVTSGVSERGGWTGPGRVEIIVVQTKPNAPSLATPINSILINVEEDLPFGWVFSSDTTGDTQSKFDLQYRLVGAGSWTTVTETQADTDYTLPASTLDPGDYEWQVRTYGATGLAGPWSSSAFFTGAAPLAAPVFTSPSSGSDVDNPTLFTFTSIAHTQLQFRRVADLAGDPDPSHVFWLGDVVNSAANSGIVSFDVNNRDEHVQVRVRGDQLWSEWGDVDVHTAFAPTVVPTVAITRVVDSEGRHVAIDVTWLNPTPAGDEIPTAFNEVWINDTDNGWERRATGLELNDSWSYRTPKSLLDYDTRIKVVAVGTNGGTAEGFPT